MSLLASSWYCDRYGRRSGALAFILMLCAAGMLLASLASNPILAFAGLCLGACVQAGVPLIYSFPAQHFAGPRSVVALAFVNSVSNLGGFVGPYLLGVLRELTSSDTLGLLVLSTAFIVAAVLSLGLKHQIKKSGAWIGPK